MEYSTQQGGIGGKFSEDLQKCFNEEKTGVPVDRIAEVVFCHNARLAPDEELSLIDAGMARGVAVRIVGPGQLAHDLYDKYPVLAQDFLGVTIDTGQLLEPRDFITAYGRAPLSTPLDTSFHFREADIAKVLAALRPGAVVLLSGRPGVGKSRLALECCKKYVEQHPDTHVKCVYNRGADLFQDIRAHFSEPGDYLILVDDANRITRFDYILQLLHDVSCSRRFAIVATVRDYALDRIQTLAGPYRPTVVELDRFSDEEIRSLVSAEFGIGNHHYLERIAAIAEGNPRLAVMAAQMAVKTDTLSSLDNVIALYDEYYRSIRADIEEIGNEGTLKAAAAIAFFRTIDRSDPEALKLVEDSFGLSPAAFWAEVQRLHDIEAVDIYENEVVRSSDQVLATYLFHLGVLRSKVIGLSSLFEQLFPAHQGRFVEVLNPIFTAFGRDTFEYLVKPQLELAWDLIARRSNSDMLALMDLFWFIRPAETLVVVAQMIDALPTEPVADEAALTFKASPEAIPSASPLGMLEHFAQGDEGLVKSALSLICEYALRRPTDASKVVRVLDESYGISHRSHLRGFHLQKLTLEVLVEQANENQGNLLPRLLMSYAQSLLLTHFQRFGPSKRLAVTIYKFDVPVTDELVALRSQAWREVLGLAESPALRGYVLEFIERHSQQGYQVASRDLVEGDSRAVLPFFLERLEPLNYRHCSIVHEYLDLLDRLSVPYDTGIRDHFQNRTFSLAALLFEDWAERRECGFEESEVRRLERIASFVATIQLSDVASLYEQCLLIRSSLDQGHDIWQFENGVRLVLLELAARDRALFVASLKKFIGDGNALGLTPFGLVQKLIEVAGAGEAFNFLWSLKGPATTLWRCSYFVALPENEVSEALLGHLVRLIQEEPSNNLTCDLDYLLKFQRIDSQVVVSVVRTLLSKAEAESAPRRILERVVCSYSEVGKNVSEIFAKDVALLKQVYFVAASERGNHADYDGVVFNKLLDMDPGFASEWVTWIFSAKTFLSRHDDHRDYKLLWSRADFMDVMERLVGAIAKEAGKYFGGSYLETFFVLRDSVAEQEVLVARQDRFLEATISAHATDADVMQVLFDATDEFEEERKRRFVAVFLGVNQDVKAFERLSLEPNGMSWTGSAVPLHEARAAYLESLLPLCGTVALLRHRKLLEDRIAAIRRQIEVEKRRDFLRD